jgi:hypothetical protein
MDKISSALERRQSTDGFNGVLDIDLLHRQICLMTGLNVLCISKKVKVKVMAGSRLVVPTALKVRPDLSPTLAQPAHCRIFRNRKLDAKQHYSMDP